MQTHLFYLIYSSDRRFNNNNSTKYLFLFSIVFTKKVGPLLPMEAYKSAVTVTAKTGLLYEINSFMEYIYSCIYLVKDKCKHTNVDYYSVLFLWIGMYYYFSLKSVLTGV